MATRIRTKQLELDLDGATLKNVTITTATDDQYSLIVSGAIAIVDATQTDITGSLDGESGSVVPAMIWMQSGSSAPSDPIISGSLYGNVIDLGEF
jgi:hypothetical protein